MTPARRSLSGISCYFVDRFFKRQEDSDQASIGTAIEDESKAMAAPESKASEK